MSEAVVLLHGLLMNRYAMLPLAARLRAAGYADHSYTYHSQRQELDAHLAAIRRRIDRLDSARIHLVGHSMGGVVALKLLESVGDVSRIGRVLLLGSPLVDCAAARAMGGSPMGRWLLGRSAGLWRGGYPLSLPAGIRAGAIAGTRRAGLGALTVRLLGASDGVVLVEETRLPGLADHMVLPVSHSGMLISRAVAEQCIAFLRHGRFARPEPGHFARPAAVQPDP